MKCSNCGSLVSPDAGFCRACGAILRGRAASATLVPSSPAVGPAPPATGPEPPSPALADAGHWAPPQAGSLPTAQGYRQAQAYEAPQGPPLPPPPPGLGHPGNSYPFQSTAGGQYVMGGQPGIGGLPPGPHTIPIWGGGAPWGGIAVAIADLRHQRRLQAIDLAAFFGAVAVLGSLFMPWYQFAYGGDGVSVAVSVTALSGESGSWRWLLLVCSLGIVAELLVTLLIFRAGSRDDWPHRSFLALLCITNLALVVIAMLDSPFAGASQIGLLSSSLAAGAYVGLVGAIVGMGAAAIRLFTGPPALMR